MHACNRIRLSILLFLLVLSSLSSLCEARFKQFNMNVPTVVNPINVTEALRLGHAVRPFVVEFGEDEFDLSPSHELLTGPDDDSLAFGHKVC
jgi:hypothetical protein